MPQLQLPIFPAGSTHITQSLAFECREGRVTYFHGQLPVFVHAADDARTFRMITSQLVVNGNATQADIARAFGVTAISVKRAVKTYRQHGPGGFYAPRQVRGAAVLTEAVIEQIEDLLAQGMERGVAARHLGLKPNTVAKAMRAGRVREKKSTALESAAVTTQRERSVTDSAALMGMGAVNVGERLLASFGKAGPVAPRFEAAADVPDAGVLLAVPAVVACGLVRDAPKVFALPRGYYGLESIFVLLALLALARVHSVEQLRYCAPGEWGKLLGLDRVPEVRTLRTKLALLTATDAPAQWSAQRCAEWMQDDPDSAGICYVDGHVRVYHGAQTALPRHYVSRQRLCLRATTDYWVNALDGQPFFVVTTAVDPGLLQTLEHDIVPRLEHDAPALVSAAELATDRLRHRFALVFDREGYRPDFCVRMRGRRIACLTYNKHPGPNWPEEEFTVHAVQVVGGETIAMHLAERGTDLGPLWMREIRRLGRGGHQTSILATDYVSELIPIAVAMFARWGQEHFFRYMREHYGLDRLISYDTEPIPDTVRVVNPARRELEGTIRARTGALSRTRAEFGGLILQAPIDPARVERWGTKKAALQEEIAGLEKELGELKGRRQDLPSHLSFKDLPEDQRFERLAVQSKHFIDTIKMIAYRAETAMVHVRRDQMAKHDEARSLLRGRYRTAADLLPDYQAGTLRVRLHHQANRATDVALVHLCQQSAYRHRHRLPPKRRTPRRLPREAFRPRPTRAGCRLLGQGRVPEIRRSEPERAGAEAGGRGQRGPRRRAVRHLGGPQRGRILAHGRAHHPRRRAEALRR